MPRSIVDQLHIPDNRVYNELPLLGDALERKQRRARDSAVSSYSVAALMKKQTTLNLLPTTPFKTSNGTAHRRPYLPQVEVNRTSLLYFVTIRHGVSYRRRLKTANSNGSKVHHHHHGHSKNGKVEVKTKLTKQLIDQIQMTNSRSNAMEAKQYFMTSCSSDENETKRLFEGLPYKGVVPFPDCLINHTEPTTFDREEFQRFLEEAEKTKQETEDNNIDDVNVNGNNHYNNNNVQKFYPSSRIERIRFRDFEINTWYTAPYPEEYSQLKLLYICEYCLKYVNSPKAYERHQLKNCNFSNKHPPGIEIYRDEKQGLSMWEVDGRKNIHYCQNLCLLAKLFLNSKTLYYDVEPFIFYILTEIDTHDRYHFVGYFSKEKLNNSDYNVSCILTLPIYQRKGYGNFLIDFSYLLTRREFKFGTPEKPLSDLGLVTYRSYWKTTIAFKLQELYQKYLANDTKKISLSLENLAKLTGMTPSDVVVGLEQLNSLVKYPRSGKYGIRINLPLVNDVVTKWLNKKYVVVDASKLFWKPMLFGSSGGINSAPMAASQANLGTSNQPTAVSAAGNPSNSIANIVNFLRDDIINPYSFEDETYKEIECYSEMEKDKDAVNDSNEYIICRPGVETMDRRLFLETPKPDAEISTLSEQNEKMSRKVEEEDDNDEDDDEDNDMEVSEDDDSSEDVEYNESEEEAIGNDDQDANGYGEEEDSGEYETDEDEDEDEEQDENDSEVEVEFTRRNGQAPDRSGKIKRLNRALEGLYNR